MDEDKVKADFGELTRSCLQSLDSLASQEGFPPYAVTLAADGPGQLMGTDPQVDPQQAIGTLVAALKKQADAGELRAFAIVFDATMTNADTGEQRDAVRILVEHGEGAVLGLALPYVVEGSTKKYGDLQAVPSKPLIFGADSGASPRTGREQADSFISRIPEYARLHVEKAASIGGVELEYDEACFEHTDSMIEEGWRGEQPAMLDVVVQTFGSFLGEAIRSLHGGEWDFDEQNQVVYLRGVGPKQVSVFPFDRVRRRFVDGADQSIAAYYRELKQNLQ